jgi:hypothetical protein
MRHGRHKPAAWINLESDKLNLENWLCDELVGEIEATAPEEGNIDALKAEAKLAKLKEASSMSFYNRRLFFNFYQAKQFVQTFSQLFLSHESRPHPQKLHWRKYG